MARHDGRVRRTTVPLPLLVGLAAALLVVGAVIGFIAGGGTQGNAEGESSPTPVAAASRTPSSLPAADVPGEDIARLPRYPGSVRTEFGIDEDDAWRTTSVELLADATLDEVRAFYQNVMVDEGWQRADISFSGGEWTYVLVDGRLEAVIELEELDGLVEIDLQLGEPVGDGGADDDAG